MMLRPLATNPHAAIDRLAETRDRIAALRAEEARLLARVLTLPDGTHDGIACRVDVTTDAGSGRRHAVVRDRADPGADAAMPGALRSEHGAGPQLS